MGSLWLVAVFVVILLAAIWSMTLVRSRYYRAKQELAPKVNLFSWDSFLAFDGLGAVAVDKKSRKILFLDQGGSRQKVVDFNDLLSVELLEDGATITKTCASGSRGLGRGTVEALVGGVRGSLDQGEEKGGEIKSPPAPKVNRIEMRLVMADVVDPFRELFFWKDDKRGLSRSSGQYARVRGESDRWCARLQMIIKQADEDEARPRQGEWRASVMS